MKVLLWIALAMAQAALAAYPDRPVVAIVGDGGFTMLMGDFLTAVKYRLPVKVVVTTAAAAVVEGVPPGARVVTEGAQNLRPGTLVREPSWVFR